MEIFSKPDEDTRYGGVTSGKDQFYIICKAVRLLADLNQDHASTLNGEGYNKMDTSFGMGLARKPWTWWTEKMIAAAYGMLHKYREQLARHGISYADIPNPVGFNRMSPNPAQETERSMPANHGPVYKQLSFKSGDTTIIEVEWRNVDREEFAAIHTEIKPIGSFKTEGGIANPAYEHDHSQPRWNKKPVRSYWEVPLNPQTAVTLREVAKRFKFFADDQVKFVIKTMATEALQLQEMSRKVADTFVVEGFGHEGLQPYPFQQAGIKFAVTAKLAGIFDDMGLGKTIQAMGALVHLQAFPALVVVPKVVLVNWQREWKRWAPQVRVMRIDTRTTAEMIALYEPDVVLLNYDILAKLLPQLSLIEWKAVVYDEAHRLKTPGAQRSQAAKILATGGKDKSKGIGVRLLLTGTPLINRPDELINLLKIMGTFNSMGFKSDEDFYKKFYWNKTLQNGKELHELLRKTCMVRRKKEEVLTELPPITRVAIPIELENEDEYAYAERNTLSWIYQEALKDKEFLDSIKNLPADVQAKMIQQHASDAEERARRALLLVRMEKLKQICVRGKIKAFKQWVEETLENDQKLVVFTTHRKVQAELHRTWETDAMILGGMNDRARQAEIDRFMQDPETMIASCALRAAGEGITLTAANLMAFLEFGWTPGEHDQAEARIHRIGQKENVTIYYFTGVRKDGEPTIDEDIFELLDSKRSVVNTVANGEETLTDNESLVTLLAKRLAQRAEKRTDLIANPVFNDEKEEDE